MAVLPVFSRYNVNFCLSSLTSFSWKLQSESGQTLTPLNSSWKHSEEMIWELKVWVNSIVLIFRSDLRKDIFTNHYWKCQNSQTGHCKNSNGSEMLMLFNAKFTHLRSETQTQTKTPPLLLVFDLVVIKSLQ